MLIGIILSIILGITLGVMAGLIPGIHPNTLFVMLVSFSWIFSSQLSYATIALIVSLAVTNAVVNFIPSIFLGAPEPDSSLLSVLPGHRLLMKGLGHEALLLSVIGCVCSLIITIITLPFLLWFIPLLYGAVHIYMHWLIIAVLAALLAGEKKKRLSVFVFLVSGLAGFMLLAAVPSEKVLFPALTGLFGFPAMIISVFAVSVVPRQMTGRKASHAWVKGSFAGWVAGIFVGILPGLGPAQAGMLSSKIVRGKEKDFLISLGGIATANVVMAFIALFSIGKTRSGASWALSHVSPALSLNDVCFIVMVASLSCFVAAAVTLRLGSLSLRWLVKRDYRTINISTIVLVLVLMAFFTGIHGLFIAVFCTAIGLGCVGMGVKRMYLMGFLMLPVILYFSGLSSPFRLFLGF